MVDVVVAEAHPDSCPDLCRELGSDRRIRVIGKASSGEEALQASLELKPDVVLLKLPMPGAPAAAVIASLRHHCPDVRVLVLWASAEDVDPRGLLSAGAFGCLAKSEGLDELVRAVLAAAKGGVWLSSSLVKSNRCDNGPAYEVGPGAITLTRGEREVLQLIADGRDNREISAALYLTEHTVRNYASHIYSKLGFSHRGEAIVWARQYGLVTPRPIGADSEKR